MSTYVFFLHYTYVSHELEHVINLLSKVEKIIILHKIYIFLIKALYIFYLYTGI